MPPLSFALVDVFAEQPLSGNPLAVVPDADHLDEHLLRQIAREFNQAETTYLLAPTVAGADHRLRSFTAAGVEVFGAGHNALGAWWWLAHTGRLGRTGLWHSQTGTAVLPVETGDDGRVRMWQQAPRYGAAVAPQPLAAALGIDATAISASPGSQVVDTGAPHLMVGVRDRGVLGALVPDTAALRELLLSVDGEGCYVYTVDTADSGIGAYARFFNPVAGIVEDPATGTAAGPLVCLLHRHGILGDRAVVAQGYEFGRPSLIDIVLDGDVPVIGGGAVISATGTLRLPALP